MKPNIRCYDNGGKTADRYTVVYMDEPELRFGEFACVGMSDNPFHPQGFGQHSTAMPGRHLGKRVAFEALPEDCRKLVLRDLNPPLVSIHDPRYSPMPHFANLP